MPAKKNSLPNFIIEPLIEADWSKLVALEKESAITPFAEAQFQRELNLSNAHLFTAKKDGTLVGYIDFWHVADELELINIAVAKSQRQKGIGQRLLQTLFDYASTHQVKSIHLEVRVSNKAAIGLYEKAGFQKVGLRKKYYPDTQEDAVVYCYANLRKDGR